MQTPVFRVCSRSRAPQERVKHFLSPMILSGEKNCASVLISEKQEGVTLAGCLKIRSLQKKTPTKISFHFYLKSASDTVLKHTDGNVQHFLLPALGAEQSEPFQRWSTQRWSNMKFKTFFLPHTTIKCGRTHLVKPLIHVRAEDTIIHSFALRLSPLKNHPIDKMFLR